METNNNVVIGSKFNDYFDNLLLKPPITNKSYTIQNFYNDYLQHNILIIFILFCIMLFLYSRYLYNQKKYKLYNDTNYMKQKKEIKNQIKYIEHNKRFLEKEKHNLEQEKHKILNIIDEISSVNDKNKINNMYNSLDNDYVDEDNITNFNNDKFQDKIISNGSFRQYGNQDNDQNNYVNGVYIEPPF